MLNDYDNMTLSICTDNQNNIDMIISALFLTIPCGLSFLCLMSLMVYTLIKPLIKIMMDKYLYPNHPVRCVITRPSECGKSVFPIKLILNTINENDELYIHSPRLHQDSYQKLIKCFSNYVSKISHNPKHFN